MFSPLVVSANLCVRISVLLSYSLACILVFALCFALEGSKRFAHMPTLGRREFVPECVHLCVVDSHVMHVVRVRRYAYIVESAHFRTEGMQFLALNCCLPASSVRALQS